MDTQFLRENGDTILEIVPQNEHEKIIFSEMNEIYNGNTRELIKLIFEQNGRVRIISTNAIDGRFLHENGFVKMITASSNEPGSEPITALLIWKKLLDSGNWLLIKGNMFQYKLYTITPDIDNNINIYDNCQYDTLKYYPAEGNTNVYLFNNDGGSLFPIVNIGKVKSTFELRRFLV